MHKSVCLPLVLMVALFATTAAFGGSDDKKPKNSDIDNIGTRDINKGNLLPLMSLEKEIALGRELSAQVERQLRLNNDTVVNEYVNRVAQNIVRNSDAKVPFTTKVVESDEINAFALPGGFLYVNTGLISAATEEAELAGVLAHEIAHVAARHGAKSVAKENAFNIASIPLIFLGGPAGAAARMGAGLGVPLTFLKFSRSQEEEADYLGAQYAYKAGYDPSAMLRMFETIQAKEKAKKGSVSALFTDHPPTPARITAVKKEIETILPDRGEYVISTSEFDQMKARLAGPDPQQTRDDRRPNLRRRRNPSSNPGDDRNSPTVQTQPDPAQTGDDDRPIIKRKD